MRTIQFVKVSGENCRKEKLAICAFAACFVQMFHIVAKSGAKKGEGLGNNNCENVNNFLKITLF